MTATEFKRTEEDMLDYLDNAAIGLHWLDGNAMILWANPADYEPLGYTADEYIGHSITEFHAEPAVINDILVRLLGGETLYNYKAKLLCKDGSTLSVLITSSGLFDEEKNFIHTRCFTIKDPRHKRPRNLRPQLPGNTRSRALVLLRSVSAESTSV